MKAIIFDFNRTLYNPETDKLINGCLIVLKFFSQNKKLALITTETGDRQNKIGQLGIDKFFKIILPTREKTKKDFLKCCQFLGVKPKDVMVVGDRVRGEIAIGNKLGMFTVQFKNGKFAKELPENGFEIPKLIIKDLRELLKYG